MLASDQFLAIFSELEQWLRKSVQANKATSFYQLVERSAQTNSIVRRYKDPLKEYADLRNAIVHERTDGHVIAEPNARALAEFRRIREALLKPQKVFPKFQCAVKCRGIHETIGVAVQDMRAGSFSQLPIRQEGKVTDLLTSETVVRWLASELENEIVSLSDSPISSVLKHVEDADHYCFLSRDASLHDAVSKFEDFASRGKDLDAILITHGGKPEHELLGILTVYDLPVILETLGLRGIAAA